ncbi:hypothetical protein FB446DRAFT_793739 [Lentinula raphanica]|nr:hypothetical protein FB446DRAFT_793739 [Lentinula raphanica]
MSEDEEADNAVCVSSPASSRSTKDSSSEPSPSSSSSIPGLSSSDSILSTTTPSQLSSPNTGPLPSIDFTSAMVFHPTEIFLQREHVSATVVPSDSGRPLETAANVNSPPEYNNPSFLSSWSEHPSSTPGASDDLRPVSLTPSHVNATIAHCPDSVVVDIANYPPQVQAPNSSPSGAARSSTHASQTRDPNTHLNAPPSDPINPESTASSPSMIPSLPSPIPSQERISRMDYCCSDLRVPSHTACTVRLRRERCPAVSKAFSSFCGTSGTSGVPLSVPVSASAYVNPLSVSEFSDFCFLQGLVNAIDRRKGGQRSGVSSSNAKAANVLVRSSSTKHKRFHGLPCLSIVISRMFSHWIRTSASYVAHSVAHPSDDGPLNNSDRVSPAFKVVQLPEEEVCTTGGKESILSETSFEDIGMSRDRFDGLNMSSSEKSSVDPAVAKEAVDRANQLLETMDVDTIVYSYFHDQLQSKPIPGPDTPFSGSFRLQRATPTELGGLYLTDDHGQHVVLEMLGEIAYSPDYTRTGPYFNMFFREGERLTIDSLRRAQTSIFVKPIKFPVDYPPEHSLFHHFHHDRAKEIMNFIQRMLRQFVEEKGDEERQSFHIFHHYFLMLVQENTTPPECL